MSKQLILTIGLPRSGKSTWAKKQRYPIVNPDSIRLALYGQAYIKEAEQMVWAIAKYMVKALFLAGHDTVVVDATNTTEERRNFWKDDYWAINYIYFPADKETCVKRAKESNTGYLIPVIERMSMELDIEECKDVLGYVLAE